jgi:hypothetical protein
VQEYCRHAASAGWRDTDVGGDVFAGGAVATGRRTHQHAVFRILTASRPASASQQPGNVAAFQAILHALVEREEALFIKTLSSDSIGTSWRTWLKAPSGGPRAGWGIRGNQLRVLRFQLAQRASGGHIPHPGFRRVHNMVEIFMMAKRGSQFSQLLFD